MHIHKVEEGETLYKIASTYGAPITKLIENNELSYPDRLVTGEELIVLLPTRTHRVRGTESLGEIARRYEIKRAELYRNNPSLIARRGVYPGQLLTIRYPAPKGGMGASLGYVPRGTERERLLLTLPYLTYFVFDGVYDGVFVLPVYVYVTAFRCYPQRCGGFRAYLRGRFNDEG